MKFNKNEITYDDGDEADLAIVNLNKNLYKELFIYQEKLEDVKYAVFLNEFTFIQRLKAYKRLLQVLTLFHRAGYVHGDVHDGNIMMALNGTNCADNFYFKLIDYGLMKNAWDDDTKKVLAFKNDLYFFLETVLKIESRWTLSNDD